jgi:trehalose 6-phosphate synthase/phosphatase
MAALHKRVIRNNVFEWGERFLANMREAAASREEHPTAKPKQLPVSAIVEAFQQAKKRRLLLDYDGTLTPYAKRPRDAAPTPELLSLLTRLTKNKANTVAVISGRSRSDLDSWLGQVRSLWLAAEHGAIMRSPDTMTWEFARASYSDEWKEHVLPVLEHFVNRTPGSLIEEKEFALVWHYRMADPVFGEWLANELASTLEQLLAETELRATRGRKIVEVKPVWASKGEALAQLDDAVPEPDFSLAAGDDRTDEDMFARLPEGAWTIHVGDNDTRAQYCLADPKAIRGLLGRFAEADEN